jgi:peptide/nickel transport system permease protein
MVSFTDRPENDALRMVVRRLLEGLLTAWAAVTVTFFALHLTAGDPLSGLLSRGLATSEQIETLRVNLGFDVPLPIQYLRYLAGFIRGDLGVSLYSRRSVSQEILSQLPATLELALAGFCIAIALGFALGILSAWKEQRWSGRLSILITGLATSLPVAFTGILALYALRTGYGHLPEGALNPIQRLVLPALVLGFATAGGIARVVQAGLRESLRQPYMLAAQARGIQSGFRYLWHALKPSLPPAISMSALEAAFLLSGTVITETIFARPGLGRLLIDSILDGDFPIAQGIVAVVAIFYTLSHIIAELLSLAIDPRLRRGAG